MAAFSSIRSPIFPSSEVRRHFNFQQPSGHPPKLASDWVSWDIRVDVVGVAIEKKQTVLAFVEYKNTPTTLRDLSQLLGYSAIARPRYSILLSPYGPSDSLRSLLKTYHRMDVLRYAHSDGVGFRSIAVVKWLPQEANIDWGTRIVGDGF